MEHVPLQAHLHGSTAPGGNEHTAPSSASKSSAWSGVQIGLQSRVGSVHKRANNSYESINQLIVCCFADNDNVTGWNSAAAIV